MQEDKQHEGPENTAVYKSFIILLWQLDEDSSKWPPGLHFNFQSRRPELLVDVPEIQFNETHLSPAVLFPV